MHAETVYFSCIIHLQKYFCPFLFLDLLLNSSQSTCFKREKNALFSNPIDMEYSWDAFDVSSPSNF